MELVLSPGRIGGGDGSGAPFQNEEVREWSHVDRLTGMLERARVETGRWQARNQGAAQAYGKVIDSRERNSADGSVVQRARRQVEVFQSQGVGGRSVQVVRASQWSSSRVTDSSSSSPIPISRTESHYKNGSEEGLDMKPAFGKLGNEDSSLSRLSQVSRLCRQIHAEAINNRVSPRLERNNSPIMNRRIKAFDPEPNTSPFWKQRIDGREGRRSPSLLNGMKSTSNEDVSNSNEKPGVKSPAIFTRDCKARRSLQAPKSSGTPVSVARKIFDDKSIYGIGVRLSDLDHGSKASRITDSDQYSMDVHESSMRKYSTTSNQATSGRPIKSYVLGMKSSDSGSTDVSPSSSDLENHRVPLYSPKGKTEQKDKDALQCNGYKEYPRPIPVSKTSRSSSASSPSKVNTTVVHLSNNVVTIRPTGDRAVTLPTGTVQCRIKSLTNRFSDATKETEIHRGKLDQMVEDKQGLLLHGSVGHQDKMFPNNVETVRRSISDDSVESLVNSFSSERKPIADDDVAFGKSVKKVGFCKTEVHFAADSGKVNIVETDGKPPPSNRFRRRRRNSLVVNAPVNKNLPLIHFGDTSYEKYIFGQSNSLLNDKPASPDFTPKRRGQEPGQAPVGPKPLNDSQDFRNGWGVKLRAVTQPEHNIHPVSDEFDSNKSYDGLSEIVTDHKHRGHTTTVNLGANVLSKIKHINQGKCNAMRNGIQLRFDTGPKSFSTPNRVPIDDVGKATSKIAVHSPSTLAKISRPLIQAQQHTALKSTHLVMSLNRIKNLSSVMKSNECNSISTTNDPLTLQNLFSSLPTCTGMVLCRDDANVDIVNNNYAARSVSTLINVDADTRSVACKNKGIINGNVYSARFTSIQSKVPNRFGCITCKRSIDAKETHEGQLQHYSSGSEQADEEVRSYMLGSRRSCQERIQHEKFTSITTQEEAIDTRDPRVLRPVEDAGASTFCNKEEISSCIDETGVKLMNGNSKSIASTMPDFPGEELVRSNVITPMSKSPIDNNVVSSDNENNQVLLNVVTTHEPVIARVESRQSPKLVGKLPSPSDPRQLVQEERKQSIRGSPRTKRSSREIPKSSSSKLKAKDHVEEIVLMKGRRDSTKSHLEMTDPTYVNVFESVEKDIPIYENCQVVNSKTSNEKDHLKTISHEADASMAELKEATAKTTNGNSKAESSQSDCEEDHPRKSGKFVAKQNLTTISENKSSSSKSNRENHKTRQTKTRSKKPVGPTSSTSSIESVSLSPATRTTKNRETKYSNGKSTRTSNLHEMSNNHETIVKKSREIRNAKETRSKTSHTNRPLDLETNAKINKDLNGSTRSKKPIEIVYQTAVFNMKNEKLSKPSKTKESKSPRYINDLICGSKSKRPVDLKHAKAMSHQRARNKSASPTNRHWK